MEDNERRPRSGSQEPEDGVAKAAAASVLSQFDLDDADSNGSDNPGSSGGEDAGEGTTAKKNVYKKSIFKVRGEEKLHTDRLIG